MIGSAPAAMLAAEVVPFLPLMAGRNEAALPMFFELAKDAPWPRQTPLPASRSPMPRSPTSRG
ncbi:hypothetical protein BRAS3809_5310003 [Bradyrhizobium sp. STM 3809]|nr:hypothetical protein BRAS3809_5310003 [Bradyrhizobium sp. STM 3809]